MKARALFVLMLVGVAFAAPAVAQQPATAPTVKAVQPGLLEVTGPRVNDAVAAGIQKITAVPGKGRRSIEVRSPWGNIYFDWPKDVKPVAFTIEAGKQGGATISAPGFTEANKADYKAAVEAVVPRAIKDAQAQKTTRTKP
jgi:hypothetical protein